MDEERTLTNPKNGHLDVSSGVLKREEDVVVAPLGEELFGLAQLGAVLVTKLPDLVRLVIVEVVHGIGMEGRSCASTAAAWPEDGSATSSAPSRLKG